MPVHEVRLGRYQDKMIDLENVDSVITDAPYSERTHGGSIERSTGIAGDYIKYNHIQQSDCEEFADFWCHRVNNWLVVFGDHVTARWWEEAFSKRGMYVFAPVFYVKSNAMPRMNGDGPTSSVEWITRATTEKHLVEMALAEIRESNSRMFDMDEDEAVITVARHRVRVVTPKSRRGYYTAKVDQRNSYVAGQKDLAACAEIVTDYSDPGDIVVDPFAGTGMIAKACKALGRSSISCEVKPHLYGLIKSGLNKPVQMSIM